MSPADARLRLVQGGSGAAVRSEVLARIRSRWGADAAEEARARPASSKNRKKKAG